MMQSGWRGALPVLAWAWALVWTWALALHPGSALADCVEAPPDPDTGIVEVRCSGDLSPGYIAGVAVEDLDVIFEKNARVTDDGVDDAVVINSNSQVQNFGRITIENDDRAGISVRAGETDVLLRNESGAEIRVGSETAPVADGVGLTVGDGSGAFNLDGGSIRIFGDDGIGIEAGDDGGIFIDQVGTIGSRNDGKLEITGSRATGISAGSRNHALSLVEGFLVVDAGVWNGGELTIVGDDGVGIRAGDDNGVLNSGTLRVSGANARGIEVGQNNLVVNFSRNLTPIEVEGANAVGILAGAGSRIDSSNPIRATGDGARGVVIGDGPAIEATLTNSGPITATGAGAIGVEVGVDSVISNIGDIWSRGGGAVPGPAILFGGDDPNSNSSLLHNREHLTGLQKSGGRAVIGSEGPVAIQGSVGSETIFSWGGVIEGDIRLGDGADTFSNFFGGVVEGDVWLEGDDDLYVLIPESAQTVDVFPGDGSDMVQLNRSPFRSAEEGGGDGAYSTEPAADFESLRVWTDGSWTVTSTGGTVYPEGLQLTGFRDSTSDVSIPGTLIIVGELEVEGSYLQETTSSVPNTNNVASSTLLKIAVTEGTPNQLVVQGDVTIQPPAVDGSETFSADLAIGYEDGIVVGSHEIIRAGGSVNGVFDSVLAPPLVPLLDVDVRYGADNVVIDVSKVGEFATFARTPNQRAVAKNLDTGYDDAVGDFASGLGTLTQQTANELARAYDQLGPEFYDAFTSTSLAWGRVQSRVFEGRPLGCGRRRHPSRPDLISFDPCGDEPWVPWVEAIGEFGSRDPGVGEIGFDQSGGGVLLGVDYKLDPNLWISAGMGGSGFSLDVDDRGDGNLYTLDIGVALAALRGNFDVRGIFSYSHGWNQADRSLDFLSARSAGDFGSDRISTTITAGYGFKFEQALIQPIVSLDYSYLGEDSVAEGGGQGMALHVDARSSNVFSTALGVHFSASLIKHSYAGMLLEWADGIWTPDLDVRWRGTWTDADRSVRARFADAQSSLGRFDVTTGDDEHVAEVGAHLRFQPISTAASFLVGYDGSFGPNTTVNVIRAEVRIPF